MIAAIRTILIADLVMSLDNVIGVAAAAKGNITLLILGLLISIPLVIFGSTLLMKVMERWPIIVTIGAALLGWVAGEMAATDPAISAWVDANAAWLHYGAPILGADHRRRRRQVARDAVDRGRGRPARSWTSRPPPTSTRASGRRRSGRVARAARRRRLRRPRCAPSGRFVDELRGRGDAVAVDLLNVQTPVHRDVSRLRRGRRDQGSASRRGHEGDRSPRARTLEQAGIPCIVHIGVGDFDARRRSITRRRWELEQIYLTETARGEGDDLTEADRPHEPARRACR